MLQARTEFDRRSPPVMGWFAALFAFLVATPAAAADIAWQPALEVAAGPGVRGPWQQNDSRYDYVDDPSVAIADNGAVAVVWVDQARKDVFFRRIGSSEALNVSRSPETFSWLPRIALAPGNPRRIFVLWQEIIFSGGSHGGEILFARSEDGGATFSRPLNLSSSVAGDGKGRINRDIWHNGSFDLVSGGNGTLYAAWTEYEGALWVARSRDGGKGFLPRSRIDEAKPARAPSLALAPDGTVYLAWTVGEDKSADIRIAKSTDAGASFGPPILVERSQGYSDAPKLALDRAGTLHLVYAESFGGPFERYRIVYTRSSDGGRTFKPPRTISPANASFPSLSLDAADDLYVAWELFDDHRQRPRGLGFAISRDLGRTFSAPAFVPESADRAGGRNGSHQGLLMRKLAVNRDGTIAIVNSSLTDNQRSRVWLIRGKSKKSGSDPDS
jgi:hypothetical protein